MIPISLIEVVLWLGAGAALGVAVTLVLVGGRRG